MRSNPPLQFGTAPILATMLLRADLAGPSAAGASGAVTLDVPLGDILARMESVFPGKTRAAIIRNPDANSVPQAIAGGASESRRE